jgi:predicted nucleic acid-binding protein
MRVYLDAAPVIYAVEQVAPYAAAVDARLSAAGVVPVASDLTRLECRVNPLKLGNKALLQDFDDYFAGAVGEIVPLSRLVIDRAAVIRAQHGFKTPDAIHLAAALESGCDVFLTNDQRLSALQGFSSRSSERPSRHGRGLLVGYSRPEVTSVHRLAPCPGRSRKPRRRPGRNLDRRP